MVSAPQPASKRFAASRDLAVREWHGEQTAAVFCPETVTTHLVSGLAAAVLTLAAKQTVSAEEAVCLLTAPDHPIDFAASDVSADLQLMEETITGLVSAGLLRRVV